MTENVDYLNNKNEPGNAMRRHNNRLLWESYETNILEGG
jgi:hypothetical protein